MDALVALQRWIYGSIGGFLGSFAVGHDWAALLAVVPLGVIFGAIHAMTPGHSKLVLASYLAGARLATFRRMVVASVLSLTHVGSAVIFALIAAPLFTRTLGNAGRAPSLEILSRGSLLVIALWLLWRAWRHRPHASRRVLARFVARRPFFIVHRSARECVCLCSADALPIAVKPET